MKKYIYATATLSGTIIGVGIFSLPYIALKVGIWVMLGYLLALAFLVVLIHLFFGEVALKTPDFLRLPGYARTHLGKWGERAALVSSIFGSFGALLAYLIVGGAFLENLLSPLFGGGNLLYTILYFAAGALVILLGIKIISKIEFWGLILFFVSLILIFIKGIPFFRLDNLFLTGDVKLGIDNFFLPYGPLLFSLSALSIIPEIEEMLGEGKKNIKKVISAGVIVPALAYLVFIFLILGITGISTSSDAISGLKNLLGQKVLALAFFAGALTTFTSFIAIGLTLKKIFWYDLKIPKIPSWLITCFLPLALFIFGIKNFIAVIGVAGGVMMGIDGILIVLMYQKVKQKKFGFMFFLLSLIFVLGIIYEIAYFLK